MVGDPPGDWQGAAPEFPRFRCGSRRTALRLDRCNAKLCGMPPLLMPDDKAGPEGFRMQPPILARHRVHRHSRTPRTGPRLQRSDHQISLARLAVVSQRLDVAAVADLALFDDAGAVRERERESQILLGQENRQPGRLERLEPAGNNSKICVCVRIRPPSPGAGRPPDSQDSGLVDAVKTAWCQRLPAAGWDENRFWEASGGDSLKGLELVIQLAQRR